MTSLDFPQRNPAKKVSCATWEEAAAARGTARQASDEQDLVLLLDAIGVVGGDDTLTVPLPLLPDHAGEAGVTASPFNAAERARRQRVRGSEAG